MTAANMARNTVFVWEFDFHLSGEIFFTNKDRQVKSEQKLMIRVISYDKKVYNKRPIKLVIRTVTSLWHCPFFSARLNRGRTGK